MIFIPIGYAKAKPVDTTAEHMLPRYGVINHIFIYYKMLST